MARAGRGAVRRLATVLVATDFSLTARGAAQRALLLPLERGATIHLLNVVRAPRGEPATRAAVAEAQLRLERVAAGMRRRARALQVPEPVVIPAAAVGSPHVEIIRKSRVVGADLTVMGRHGQRSLRELVVGTTAGRVVRLGDTPVLVVSQAPEGPYRRPLVGVDLEDASASLLLLAVRVLPAQAGAVTLVHVCRGPAWGRLIEAAATRRERAEGRRIERRVAAVRLRALVSELRGRAGGLPLRPVILRGDPRHLLLQQAARRGADLLVLGTHGRAGLSHVLLGSVAERVLAAAPCDVLVARPARFTFQLP